MDIIEYFRVLFPKISTGQKKLAPTGLHSLHVFATQRYMKVVSNWKLVVVGQMW